jgi:hypothetical protein
MPRYKDNDNVVGTLSQKLPKPTLSAQALGVPFNRSIAPSLPQGLE